MSNFKTAFNILLESHMHQAWGDNKLSTAGFGSVLHMHCEAIELSVLSMYAAIASMDRVAELAGNLKEPVGLAGVKELVASCVEGVLAHIEQAEPMMHESMEKFMGSKSN